MKKFLPYLIVIILAGGAGLWLGHGPMTMDEAADPTHKHQLERKTDAEGKVYYTCGMHPQVRKDEPGNCPICGMKLIEKTDAAPTTDGGERKILYWYDPMRPDQHFDKPGKSPFMDMDLVPRYADEMGGGGADIVSIDPRMVQNLGIRSVAVETGAMSEEVRAAGTVMADETRIEVVQSRTAGWVERLRVQSVGDPVRRGQLLAEVYSPELYAAQQEFVIAQRAKDAALMNASRERMRLLGISAAQLSRLEETGEPQRRVAYYAPLNGIVAELGVREGAQLNPGMSLFTLVDLSRVWVVAEIPEAQASELAAGAEVLTRVAALPGKEFSGRIDYVYPQVNQQTRTLKARAVVDNPALALKPGMFADVLLGRGGSRDALLIPTEALIRTGTRTTVIVAEGEGRFRPVAVTIGTERSGRTEILSGLKRGQRVVASGQFLIDSEANLRGAFNRLSPTDEGATDAMDHSGHRQ